MRRDDRARVSLRRLLSLFFLTGALVSEVGASAVRRDGDPTDAERRGKRIYLRGESAEDRAIVARFGDAAIEVPASALPCVNCHGFDGRGRPEGGITPSDIRWETLTKPYGLTHPSGRQHPPYTERSLRTAITQGLDPARNVLPSTMPRFLLTHQEAADVVAYLKRIGKIPDPGLTEDSLRLGSLLPADESLAGPIRAVLAAYVGEVNEAGGIHGRRVELRFATAGADSAETLRGLRALLEEEEVFALAASPIEGAEEEVTALLEEKEVPLVGAFTEYPEIRFPLNRYVFYLSAGVRDQALAMARFAAGESHGPTVRTAILHPSNPRLERIASALAQECARAGGSPPVTVRYARESFDAQALARRLSDEGIAAAFLLASGEEQRALLEEARRIDWNPLVFVPGPFVDGRILGTSWGTEGKLFLSAPRGPGDPSRPGAREFLAFVREHRLPPDRVADEILAYCTADVLVEALKRAGRDVCREKLVQTLEGFYEFETGLLPPLTFGPNRRVGAPGAYVVGIDPASKRLVPVSDWIEVR